MKKALLISLPLYLLGLIYLFLPQPIYPDLKDSLRSNEPGDSWQHPDQKAFFTQKDRSTVLSELQNQFSLSLFDNLSFRLNYRPEETSEFVRPHIDSNYLEEIVHPLRESLFVNGWEPQNAPLYQSVPDDKKPFIVINDQAYYAKITLKPIFSSIISRFLIWTLIFPSLYLAFKSLTKSFTLKL